MEILILKNQFSLETFFIFAEFSRYKFDILVPTFPIFVDKQHGRALSSSLNCLNKDHVVGLYTAFPSILQEKHEKSIYIRNCFCEIFP